MSESSTDAKKCARCDGHGVVDDRGSPLRGQPFFDTQPCPVCGEPFTCKRCGKPRRSWQVYCGAACSAQSEAGQ